MKSKKRWWRGSVPTDLIIVAGAIAAAVTLGAIASRDGLKSHVVRPAYEHAIRPPACAMRIGFTLGKSHCKAKSPAKESTTK